MNPQKPLLTSEQIEIRVWAIVVLAVTLILFAIVAMLLYSVTFVTQPIKSMAPIDQAYTKMLNDIVLLIVGGIGGVISKKAIQSTSQAFTTPSAPTPVTALPVVTQNQATGFNWMGFTNPPLDESWTPGPPPTTPPEHLDPDREAIANERAVAKEVRNDT